MLTQAGMGNRLGPVHKVRPAPEFVVRVIAKRILTGIANLHDAGIYHLDVKPGNVALLTSNPICGSAR